MTLFQPETYAITLLFMIASMICWGSWANAVKFVPGYRFQLFYWDYVIGLIMGALAWGFTLDTLGSTSRPLVADLLHANGTSIVWAIVGGVIFNISAAWGVFVWHEFSSASRRSKSFLVWMFGLCLLRLIEQLLG